MDGILDVHKCEIILNAGRFCDQHLQAFVLATLTTTGLHACDLCGLGMHEKVRRKTPCTPESQMCQVCREG